jgi:hypothetical protein
MLQKQQKLHGFPPYIEKTKNMFAHVFYLRSEAQGLFEQADEVPHS